MPVPTKLTAAYCQRRAAQALDKAQENAGFEAAASLNATAAGWHQLSQELRWVEQSAAEDARRALDDTMRPCRCITTVKPVPVFEPGEPLVDLGALRAHVDELEALKTRLATDEGTAAEVVPE